MWYYMTIWAQIGRKVALVRFIRSLGFSSDPSYQDRLTNLWHNNQCCNKVANLACWTLYPMMQQPGPRWIHTCLYTDLLELSLWWNSLYFVTHAHTYQHTRTYISHLTLNWLVTIKNTWINLNHSPFSQHTSPCHSPFPSPPSSSSSSSSSPWWSLRGLTGWDLLSELTSDPKSLVDWFSTDSVSVWDSKEKPKCTFPG